MKIELEVSRIVVIESHGTDAIMLTTSLPEACWPYEGGLSLEFRTAQGTGVEYVSTHFPGSEPEVIKVNHSKILYRPT